MDRAQIVRGLYASLTGASPDPLERWLAPEFVLDVPGDSPNAGRHAGRAAFQSFLARAAELTGGTLRLALHDVAVGDEHAVAVATYTATRPDRAPLENHLCHLVRFAGDQIVYSRLFTGDQYAVDAFWRA